MRMNKFKVQRHLLAQSHTRESKRQCCVVAGHALTFPPSFYLCLIQQQQRKRKVKKRKDSFSLFSQLVIFVWRHDDEEETLKWERESRYNWISDSANLLLTAHNIRSRHQTTSEGAEGTEGTERTERRISEGRKTWKKAERIERHLCGCCCCCCWFPVTHSHSHTDALDRFKMDILAGW